MINVNMTDKAGVTLATAGKYCADNVKVTPSAEILRKDEQAKTATPTTSAQDITPDAGKALSKVTVNPITAAIVGDLDADSFAPAIVAAVEGKGVTVPSGTLLDGMAALIESIEAGGGGGNVTCKIGTVTPEADTLLSDPPYTIQHNLGRIPKAFFIYASSRDAWGSDIYSVLFVFGFEIDAGGIPTVITSGYYSNDDSNNKIQNANYAYGVAYKKNHTLQTAQGSNNNATMSICEATEEIIKIKYASRSGCLKGGWTYTWIAI